MIGLTWFFNFTHAGGGRGKSTVVRVHFDGSHCQLPNYPRLPYALHGEASTCSWESGSDEARAEAGARPQSSEGAVSGADGSGGGGGGGGESRRGPGRALSALRSMLSLHEMPKPDFEDSMDLEVPRQQFVQIADFPPHWVRRLSVSEYREGGGSGVREGAREYRDAGVRKGMPTRKLVLTFIAHQGTLASFNTEFIF